MKILLCILLLCTVLSLFCKAQVNKEQNQGACDPKITLAGFEKGKISHAAFLSDSVIAINDENCKQHHEIVSFKITIIQIHKQPLLDFPCEGNKIPAKVRAMIKEAPNGSRVIFDYFRIKPPLIRTKQAETSVLEEIPMSFIIDDL
jgi:hypothetical protein